MPFPNIPEFVAAYAQGNGCNPTPTTLTDTENVTGIRYSACDQDADVVFYSIADGGHTWPGGSPLPETDHREDHPGDRCHPIDVGVFQGVFAGNNGESW
jgi:poly(3-hydroxybutyrate) depolymerase